MCLTTFLIFLCAGGASGRAHLGSGARKHSYVSQPEPLNYTRHGWWGLGGVATGCFVECFMGDARWGWFCYRVWKVAVQGSQGVRQTCRSRCVERLCLAVEDSAYQVRAFVSLHARVSTRATQLWCMCMRATPPEVCVQYPQSLTDNFKQKSHFDHTVTQVQRQQRWPASGVIATPVTEIAV